jgi:hypothetical protein
MLATLLVGLLAAMAGNATGPVLDRDTVYACTWSLNQSAVTDTLSEPCQVVAQTNVTMARDPVARITKLRITARGTQEKYSPGAIEELADIPEEAIPEVVRAPSFMVNLGWLLNTYMSQADFDAGADKDKTAMLRALYAAYIAQPGLAKRRDLAVALGGFISWYVAHGEFDEAVKPLVELAAHSPDKETEMAVYLGIHLVGRHQSGTEMMGFIEAMSTALGSESWRTNVMLFKILRHFNDRYEMSAAGQSSVGQKWKSSICRVMQPTVEQWLETDHFSRHPQSAAFLLSGVADECFQEKQYQQAQAITDYLVARKERLLETGSGSVYARMRRLGADVRLAQGDYAGLRAFFENTE